MENFYGTQEVKINHRNATRLKSFMKEELAYYNGLLTVMLPYYSRDPKFFKNLTEEQIEIFGEVAKTGFRASTIRHVKESTVLPASLEKYRHFLLGKENGVRIMTESFIHFLDAAATPAAISTGTRMYMAREMLKYFINLANGPSRENNLAPTRILEQMDDSRKRHLQIHRTCMEIKWNEDMGVSEITIPYMADPIIVPYNIKKIPFSIMIVKQAGRSVPVPTTPWEVEFRITNSQYQLTYLDNSNPYSASSNFRYARKTGG